VKLFLQPKEVMQGVSVHFFHKKTLEKIARQHRIVEAGKFYYSGRRLHISTFNTTPAPWLYIYIKIIGTTSIVSCW
jgi:hypothetical protein